MRSWPEVVAEEIEWTDLNYILEVELVDILDMGIEGKVKNPQ